VSFNVIPTDAIHIQLVWDSPSTDVDLHLLRENPAGSYTSWSDNDCYYGDCKAPDGLDTKWFPALPDANPTLDVDDLDGYGPENINIDTPADGKYMVAVHFYSDSQSEGGVAILRLYLFGNLHSEYIAEIAYHDWWQVAVIEWPSRTVTAIDEVTSSVSPTERTWNWP
jgi:uncharacterized protein YfaP (DUF2135 family)